jgi:acetyl esterase/lipase
MTPFKSGSLVFAASLILSAASAHAQDRQKNIVYAEVHGVGLVMDVFTPSGDRNGLAVVDVVSGAWFSGRDKIRDHEQAQTFKILCEHGYTVFAIRPGSISRFSIPDMVEHIETGIVWVKKRAQEYGIAPDRIVMMGASAGGHLASLTAVTNGNSDVHSGDDKATVKAVAVFFPPTDFSTFMKNTGPERTERVRRMTGPGQTKDLSEEEIKQSLLSISPAHLVRKDAPPFLLIHGTADTVVPQRQSEIFQQALTQKGVSAELILKEGGGHPWPTIHEEVAVIANWFDRQLGNELKP